MAYQNCVRLALPGEPTASINFLSTTFPEFCQGNKFRALVDPFPLWRQRTEQ